MIILRQREFGRTGLSKDQAKEWFKGGQGKINKAAKNNLETSIGNTKYSGTTSYLNKAKSVLPIKDPAKWITRLNQKPLEYGYYKDVDSIITARGKRSNNGDGQGIKNSMYNDYPPRFNSESMKSYISRIKRLKSEE